MGAEWRSTSPACLSSISSAPEASSQYSALLAAQAQSDADIFADLDRWMTENLNADLTVRGHSDRLPHKIPATSPGSTHTSAAGRRPRRSMQYAWMPLAGAWRRRTIAWENV